MEILLLIFEEVHCIAPASLRDLRFASRQFNVLVTPIMYRHVRLNGKLVKCFKQGAEHDDPLEVVEARGRVRSAICTFTRQITIDKELNWWLVVEMLSSLEEFNHLNWSFWKGEGISERQASRSASQSYPIPYSILHCLAERWPSAQISLDKLSPNIGTTGFSYLPHDNIVYLKLNVVFWGRFNMVERTLKTFLLQCDHLDVLHIVNMRSGSRFLDEEIEQSERLPAIKELYLQSYFWLHSPQVATRFWNWSKLTSLRLEKVFIINFLESVAPETFLQLRSLITDGHCESTVDHTKVSTLHVR